MLLSKLDRDKRTITFTMVAGKRPDLSAYVTTVSNCRPYLVKDRPKIECNHIFIRLSLDALF